MNRQTPSWSRVWVSGRRFCSLCAYWSGPLGFGVPADSVIRELRLLSACSAAVIGAALAASGTLLQATLRNPLASPWVLGLTSGASLGVVTVIVAGGSGTGLSQSGDGRRLYGARAGLLARSSSRPPRSGRSPADRRNDQRVLRALTMLLQQFLPDRGLARFSRWMLGTVSEQTPWPVLGGMGVLTLLGVLVAMAPVDNWTPQPCPMTRHDRSA